MNDIAPIPPNVLTLLSIPCGDHLKIQLLRKLAPEWAVGIVGEVVRGYIPPVEAHREEGQPVDEEERRYTIDGQIYINAREASRMSGESFNRLRSLRDSKILHAIPHPIRQTNGWVYLLDDIKKVFKL